MIRLVNLSTRGEHLKASVGIAAERALDFIEDGMIVGLGSGYAAETFVRVLADRGLRVRGVPTSQRTAEFASAVGVTVTSLAAVERVDVTIDGADEVDPQLDLIKGYGGALLREKIVAANSARRVIIVDESKLVPRLGRRGRLPVEIVPFGLPLCRRRLGGAAADRVLDQWGEPVSARRPPPQIAPSISFRRFRRAATGPCGYRARGRRLG